MLKMIKEDNLSDTNELYLTLHKAGDLCSQSLFREMPGESGKAPPRSAEIKF